MPIHLLALDLDGTLLNSRGELSERNFRAVATALERGVRVALVTGRRFRDARPLALELGLDVPVISHNGALTKHARTLETVSVALLPLEAAREVLRLGRAMGADALVSDDPRGAGVLVYDHMSDDNQALAKYIAWSRRIHGDEAEEAVRRVPSLEDYLDHAPVHISFSGSVARMKDVEERLHRDLSGRVKVLCTIYPKMDFALVDVLHPEVSKGTGVRAAAEEQGLTHREVMAIGDNFNDLEMLQYAGTGVLMGNADASLRSLLQELGGCQVTATNDEDGVALAIEKFILGELGARGQGLEQKCS
ncbi:MAG TPA: Cof-type HAD-IIB family hydrolase [Pyrinomonadaceae bacterium]|nr:Cof-type HAD-IIB family hydrolase [Pyrinomonadaceae bacterium]